MLAKRFWLGVGLLAAFWVLPWWLVALFTLIGFIIFNNYYEGLGAGLLIDLVYGARVVDTNVWPFPFFLVAVLLFFLVPPLKYRLWY